MYSFANNCESCKLSYLFLELYAWSPIVKAIPEVKPQVSYTKTKTTRRRAKAQLKYK